VLAFGRAVGTRPLRSQAECGVVGSSMDDVL
jgi:hypothetical protein